MIIVTTLRFNLLDISERNIVTRAKDVVFKGPGMVAQRRSICVVADKQAGPHGLKKHLEFRTNQKQCVVTGARNPSPENVESPRSVWAAQGDRSQKSKARRQRRNPFGLCFPLHFYLYHSPFDTNDESRVSASPALSASGDIC